MSTNTHLIYEVNLEIDPSIYEAYKTWLNKHITEMLLQPGFVSANCYQVKDTTQQSCLLTIHYHVTSDHALQDYLTHKAPFMRKEGYEKFGQNFKATRRILYAMS
ncbi:MAG: DUF4286 family protein [Bdellovibrionales bacterium]|nr:DUF4286 family protein [Bdellovibrionales bacterium]